MGLSKSANSVASMSALAAGHYVKRLLERETRGSGDTEGALRRLEAKFGLPYWALVHLRRGVAKTIDADLFMRIRGAYLTYCEDQIRTLQHELVIERALVEADDDLLSLETEAAELAAKIAKAKSRLKRRAP